MPTGYTLPYDTPLNIQAKANSIITSNVRDTSVFKIKKEITFYECISSDVPMSVDEVQGSL